MPVNILTRNGAGGIDRRSPSRTGRSRYTIFIYFIEEDDRFLPLVKPLFEAIDHGALPAAVSALTLMEVLVVPYRNGNAALADRYEAFLTNSRGLRFIDIDRLLLKTAAQLRATTRLKPPDAIQVAAAMVGGCQVFVTNDRKIPSISGLSVVQLKNYLPSAKTRRS